MPPARGGRFPAAAACRPGMGGLRWAGDGIGRAARLQAVAGRPRRSTRERHPPGRRGASHLVRRHRPVRGAAVDGPAPSVGPGGRVARARPAAAGTAGGAGRGAVPGVGHRLRRRYDHGGAQLREFGLSSRLAALVAMLAMVSVPWGAWAPGTLVASELAGVDFDTLGAASARLMLPAFLACGFAALAAVEGARGALRRAADVALAAAGLWMGIWGANLLVGTAPAGAVGSAAAAGTVVVLANRRARGRPSAAGCAAGSAAGVPPGADAPSRIAFGRALVPYAV